MKNRTRGAIALILTALLAVGAFFGMAPAMADEPALPPAVEVDATVQEEAATVPTEDATPEPEPATTPVTDDVVVQTADPAPIADTTPEPAPAAEPVTDATTTPEPEALKPPLAEPQPGPLFVQAAAEEEALPPANLGGTAGGTCLYNPSTNTRDTFFTAFLTFANSTSAEVPEVQPGTLTAVLYYVENGPAIGEPITRDLASGQVTYVTFPLQLEPRLPDFPYFVEFKDANGTVIAFSYVADFEGVCANHVTPGLVAPNPNVSITETATIGTALINYTVPEPTGAGQYTTNAELDIRVDGTSITPVTAEVGVDGSTNVPDLCGPDGPKSVVVYYGETPIATSSGLDFGCVYPSTLTGTITSEGLFYEVNIENIIPQIEGQLGTTEPFTVALDGVPVSEVIFVGPGQTGSFSGTLPLPIDSDGVVITALDKDGNVIATLTGAGLDYVAPDEDSTLSGTIKVEDGLSITIDVENIVPPGGDGSTEPFTIVVDGEEFEGPYTTTPGDTTTVTFTIPIPTTDEGTTIVVLDKDGNEIVSQTGVGIIAPQPTALISQGYEGDDHVITPIIYNLSDGNGRVVDSVTVGIILDGASEPNPDHVYTVEAGTRVEPRLLNLYADNCAGEHVASVWLLDENLNPITELATTGTFTLTCEDDGNGGGNGGGNGNSELCKETGPGWQDKVDVSGEIDKLTVNAPEGSLIAGSCVKAGTTTFIVLYEEPVSSVVIDHPEKDSISHYQLLLVPVDDGNEGPGTGGSTGGTPGNNPDKGPDKVKDKTGKISKASLARSGGTELNELASTNLPYVIGAGSLAIVALIAGLTLVVIKRRKPEEVKQRV